MYQSGTGLLSSSMQLACHVAVGQNQWSHFVVFGDFTAHFRLWALNRRFTGNRIWVFEPCGQPKSWTMRWALGAFGSCAQLWDSPQLAEAREQPQRNGRWRSEKKMLPGLPEASDVAGAKGR